MNYLNKVYHCEALELLSRLPDASVDTCITDPPYGVAKNGVRYGDWVDDCNGNPKKWARLYLPIYHECLRVLRPGGKLAWAAGWMFHKHFPEWFGNIRVWSFARTGFRSWDHIWLCQSREQEFVNFPADDALIVRRPTPKELLREHRCPKSVEELRFMVKHLSKEGETVLDPFCGLGSCPVACALLGRHFVACDRNRRYAGITRWRLDQLTLTREGN